MKNKSFEKKFLTASLALLVAFSSISASFLAGCGCDDNTETGSSSNTSIVSGTIDNSDDNSQTNNDPTQEQNQSQTDPDNNSANSQNSNSSSTTNNGDSDSSNAESQSNSSSSSKPSNNSSSSTPSKKPSGNTITLDGKKFKVGDTVTYTYKLTCPEVLVNYQGYVTYDANYLQLSSAKLSKPASNSSMMNKNTPGSIIFVGSEISQGYDYTKKADFLTVTYKVIGGGETSTDLAWEYATGFDETKNNSYAENNKPVHGAKIDVEIK